MAQRFTFVARRRLVFCEEQDTSDWGVMYEYRAKLNRVVDGDTVDFDVDCGFGIWLKERFRLWGINAPESNRRASMVEGKAATQHLIGLLEPGEIMVKTHKDKAGKYGRMLCEILVKRPNGEVINCNDQMVRDGHAIEYMRDR